MTATASVFFVSDTFLYVRNTVVNGGTPSVKQQAAYLITGATLTVYRAIHTVVSSDEPTDSQRELIVPTRSGELMIVR